MRVDEDKERISADQSAVYETETVFIDKASLMCLVPAGAGPSSSLFFTNIGAHTILPW